jgi:hypothetical protein
LALLAVTDSDERRRRVRRSAWILLAVAAAFYLAFITMSVMMGHS